MAYLIGLPTALFEKCYPQCDRWFHTNHRGKPRFNRAKIEGVHQHQANTYMAIVLKHCFTSCAHVAFGPSGRPGRAIALCPIGVNKVKLEWLNHAGLIDPVRKRDQPGPPGLKGRRFVSTSFELLHQYTHMPIVEITNVAQLEAVIVKLVHAANGEQTSPTRRGARRWTTQVKIQVIEALQQIVQSVKALRPGTR